VLLPLILALLLGLRHATDPDHLTAVSTLLLNEERNGPRRAALLGLAWGLGHATTLFAFGVPVILFSRHLTRPVRLTAEVLIGGIIVALAVRLLVRWRRGYFHAHPHSHGAISHIHPHLHERSHGSAGHPAHHTHAHAERLGRSPVASFGIGLIHGVGGSAGAGILLMSTVSGKAQGVIALLVFATATAGSMSLLSVGLAHVLTHHAVRRRLTELIPLLGAAGMLFGVWYSLEALQGRM
jgi:cytochrome c biogenesis protein CcdA